MAASLEFRLTGGGSNSDPDASLGGVMSSEELSATALNNLFDNVSPAEADAGDTEYRAIDIYNAGDAQAESVSVYIDTETTSASSSIDIGHDGTNDPHAAAADLETVANESTAPSDPTITFTHSLVGSKLSLPAIPDGDAVRLWIKRVITAEATNIASDEAGLTVEYA